MLLRRRRRTNQANCANCMRYSIIAVSYRDPHDGPLSLPSRGADHERNRDGLSEGGGGGLKLGFDDPYRAVTYSLLIAILNRVWVVA